MRTLADNWLPNTELPKTYIRPVLMPQFLLFLVLGCIIIIRLVTKMTRNVQKA